MQFTRYDKVWQPAFEQRPGVTLIELIVTIVVLSIVLAITTLSLAGEKHPSAAIASVPMQVRALRSAAVASGIPQTGTVSDSAGVLLVTALPDGRVVSDLANLDRVSGVVRKGDAR